MIIGHKNNQSSLCDTQAARWEYVRRGILEERGMGSYGMWRRNCNSACTCKENEQSTACSDTISLSDRMGCFWWEAGKCCFCHHRTGGNRAGEIPFFSCTSCQKACGWRVYRKFSKVQKWRGNVWISAVCFLNPRFDIEYIERIRYKTDIKQL